MVTVSYKGRTGNNLFQYALARLIAQFNHLMLGTEWCDPKFVEATEPVQGDEVMGGGIKIEDGENLNIQFPKYSLSRVHLDGYFQKAEYYNPYRDIIRGFWKFPEQQKNTEDIIIHLRLTDYWWKNNLSVIHPSWYRQILKMEKYRKLYIVVEPHYTNTEYLRHFNDLRPEYVSLSPREDFDFIRSFDRIVCSNSSFCWWAAFLSDARKIYTFLPWMNGKNIQLARMVGAMALNGSFIRNRDMESLDWTDYWKQVTLNHYKKAGIK